MTLKPGWCDAVAKATPKQPAGYEELRASGGKPIRRKQSDLRASAKRESRRAGSSNKLDAVLGKVDEEDL